ncbi:hypothetical protein E8E13_000968 [Curvularia kusanoi]|uniref:Uncharacterized protein n=1 Tax=Curvularia kusanoi TaxID=90978 RepID=A0A9P4W6A0_CURKU|nr:hypothetical protein E8E13_000968 [Curvularia kusanoi]
MQFPSITEESRRILGNVLLMDDSLRIPSAFVEAAGKILFTASDDKPFLPSPCKITETASALYGLIAAGASAVSAVRYGSVFQDIKVNTDVASLSLFSVILPTVADEPFMDNEHLKTEFMKGDIYGLSKPICARSNGLYRTKGSRWYYSHSDFNAGKAMEMLGIEENDTISYDEAYRVYAEKIAQWDAQLLEETANSEYRISGTQCLSHEEFLCSEPGKIVCEEPLYTLNPVRAPRSQWPNSEGGSDSENSPLTGIKVIDLSRVIAAPVISKILAVLGAEVLKISWEELPDYGFLWVDLSTGKGDTNIDLKSRAGQDAFSALLQDADVLIDGYRPGVLDRLGFCTEVIRDINPRLIIVRENCYGWTSSLADRAGWQPNSDCLVGHSWLQGQFLGLEEPVLPPLPANSDMQTGLIGAAATIQALYMRTQADATFDVKTSLTQYNVWLYRLGQYTDAQQRWLRDCNTAFNAQHSDSVQTLLAKTHQAVLQTRPDLFQHQEYFWCMEGKEWGLDEDIRILAPAFEFKESKLGYRVPSGRRGRSVPRWTKDL